MKPFRLSRRAILRGLGVAIALPVLDSMLDERGLLHGVAHAQTAARPKRYLLYFWPHGSHMANYTPHTVGAGYALSPALAPFDGFTTSDGLVVPSVKNDINVLTGLDTGEIPAHLAGVGVFSTGLAAGGATSNGPSIDQVLAAQASNTCRVRSVAVCADRPEPGLAPSHNNVSWRGRNDMVPSERDPASTFATLFGSPGGTTGAGPNYRHSVLDYVLDDATRLRARVGAADQARIDEHLATIRALEVEATTPAPTCSHPAATATPTDEPLRARLFLRLIVMAFRCDVTRYATYMSSDARTTSPMPFLTALTGSNGTRSRHGISHDTSATGLAARTAITQYEMQQFAYLVSLLKSTPDGAGGGTLLDNTFVHASSEMSQADVHEGHNVPVLVAGQGAGRMVTGRHISYYPSGVLPVGRPAGGYPNGVLVQQLQVGVLRRFGMSESAWPSGSPSAMTELPGLWG